MFNLPARSIAEQIQILKDRKMLFRDEEQAFHCLKNISFYWLIGYWWDMQEDRKNHLFYPDTYFEDVLERYNFDRHLCLILFNAIERIEIALRTKMNYHLSMSYGATWYLNSHLFTNENKYKEHKKDLKRGFKYSQESFIIDHKKKHPNTNAESWKIMEIASMGTISKLYKNLRHQLPEKSIIAKDMGLNLHSELSSWLEAIVYVRNIIAHHAKLWSRDMVKKPIDKINNPIGVWFDKDLLPVQRKKPFLIISSMIYLCNQIVPNHQIKNKILELINNNPSVPIYKIGFLNNWNSEPIWK